MVWRNMFALLRRDKDFRWFLAARSLAQITSMALAFYTIYGVRRFGMDEQTAGIMTAVLMLAQMAASPIVGWAGDRWGHRIVFTGGALMMTASTVLALTSTELGWLSFAFGLAGFFNAVLWTTIMSMTAEFGTSTDRPLYFGLANTLTGPATLLAPLVGGWLADSVGFEATFLVSAVSGILTVLVLQFAVRRSIEPVMSPARVSAYLEK
jgi:MFS family permease